MTKCRIAIVQVGVLKTQLLINVLKNGTYQESQVLIRKYGLYAYLQITKIKILISPLYKKKMVVCMLGESPCIP